MAFCREKAQPLSGLRILLFFRNERKSVVDISILYIDLAKQILDFIGFH